MIFLYILGGFLWVSGIVFFYNYWSHLLHYRWNPGQHINRCNPNRNTDESCGHAAAGVFLGFLWPISFLVVAAVKILMVLFGLLGRYGKKVGALGARMSTVTYEPTQQQQEEEDDNEW